MTFVFCCVLWTDAYVCVVCILFDSVHFICVITGMCVPVYVTVNFF